VIAVVIAVVIARVAERGRPFAAAPPVVGR
jgi:hypothetical protein